ncbi:MAG: isocitrate lyase/PEP mutase family protein [Acidimicrobiales bacterium]
MSTPGHRLRTLIGEPGLIVCPVVNGPLSARLAQDVGFSTVLLGGLGVAAERFALPDLGLITFSDMLDQVRNTCAAVPGFSVIADGDTGYGNVLNVRRTVMEYARAGAAGILIEDQLWPKKCGHYSGRHAVLSAEEARMKIRAAVDARRDAGVDIIIVARTDARSAVDLDEAMRRAKAFEEEGADVVFIEALKSEEELRRFAASLTTHTWANMMPRTPLVSRHSLAEMGFKIVTYNVALAATVHSVRAALTALAKDDMSQLPPLASFDELAELVELPAFKDAESRYAIAEQESQTDPFADSRDSSG